MVMHTGVPRGLIVCPNTKCGRTYEVERVPLGPNGRQVRCDSCRTVWFQSPAKPESNGRAANPVLSDEFPRKLKQYLNGLPDGVKRQSARTTHAIKTFLMKEGVNDQAVGHANGIKVNLPHFRNVEFLWDAVGKVPNPEFPGEDLDLTFVAESENQIGIERILEDAIKLPIVRADARLMFFRANDLKQLEYFFERLQRLFERHRKTQIGDIYILAGMEMRTLIYFVRKLTIRREFSNVSPWEKF
jgi:predicted Zn finger-like uncharacterized protein